ncbi:hypothetical protein LCM00_20030 [Bacillus infantis]|uniref:hypothetical protein n=1 Tax=Bacillus infantis TaxID=324767 RepID=UPI001CD2D68D|nr:hypothetical protein [Bacillus infantis]MCA1041789.1 hypothetical protein [Bacillus infantis]
MIALVDGSMKMKDRVRFTDYYSSPEQLLAENLQKFNVILINGNQNGHPQLLSYPLIEKLYNFVEQGGILYGELINCENFPASRLFGFKQDFGITSRRLEKLVISREHQFARKGQLMEWQGPFLTGFTFDTDRLIDIGHFKETHLTEVRKADSYPGIVTKEYGKGKAIFSSFSFLGTEKSWVLRPNWAWNKVIAWLNEEYGLPITELEPVILLSGSQDVDKVLKKGVEWFLHSGILPEENGRLGVYENVHSIRSDISKDLRPDCHAHTALFFYLYGEYTKERKWSAMSDNILSYLFKSGYQDSDPESATYGFWKWFQSPKEKPDQIFSDDNSWVALVLLYLYRKTGNKEYKRRGLMTARALLSTQNKKGLRPECIRENELIVKGADYFKTSAQASMNPHFESIVHAAFIQAYYVTKDEAFLQTAYLGTLALLENKAELKYMYSQTAGCSRFLLSLAHLFAVTKDDRIKEGLYETIEYLKDNQHRLGGIEESDNPDPDRYGTEDTGVFRQNHEGIADQLYTNNFLMMNAWEAWKATEDPVIRNFHENLETFITRIQINSAKNEFNGGWMRSFHLDSGEYFGNNGDTGWGAYVIESGWTNAIILSGLLLKKMNQSLLEMLEGV